MKRDEILNRAISCVCGEREEAYGSPEDSFRVIGNLWECYLSAKCLPEPAELYILPEDVAVLMALVKVGRIAAGSGKDDNWVDLAGYAALGGELQAQWNETPETRKSQPERQEQCEHLWYQDLENLTCERCAKCGERRLLAIDCARTTNETVQ